VDLHRSARFTSHRWRIHCRRRRLETYPRAAGPSSRSGPRLPRRIWNLLIRFCGGAVPLLHERAGLNEGEADCLGIPLANTGAAWVAIMSWAFSYLDRAGSCLANRVPAVRTKCGQTREGFVPGCDGRMGLPLKHEFRAALQSARKSVMTKYYIRLIAHNLGTPARHAVAISARALRWLSRMLCVRTGKRRRCPREAVGPP